MRDTFFAAVGGSVLPGAAHPIVNAQFTSHGQIGMDARKYPKKQLFASYD